MKARLVLLALTLGVALVAAPAASAQEPASLTQVVPVTGKAGKSKTLRANYAIERFRSVGGRLVAEGTLRGRIGGRRVAERKVRLPALLSGPTSAAQVPQVPPLPPLPNACQILNLVLGPVNLDLLGLVVRTNQINLRIDGQRGPGNLLGNLLCAITGLLDPQALSPQQAAAPLNAALALVPRR